MEPKSVRMTYKNVYAFRQNACLGLYVRVICVQYYAPPPDDRKHRQLTRIFFAARTQIAQNGTRSDQLEEYATAWRRCLDIIGVGNRARAINKWIFLNKLSHDLSVGSVHYCLAP